jgi:hypothetical protein
MLTKVLEWFKIKTVTDLAMHRKYTVRYEDLCM